MTEIGENNARDRTLSGSSDPDVEPQFEPVVRLPEIKVTTNEEDEVVLVKLRARLYRFDTSNEDGPEWKERGTGEVKLLRHKENNSCRVVMRRDKTFKVCANHFITPWMELKPSVNSDRAFVYTVPADFADELAKTECLAIKFASVEFANLFKEKFNEAKNHVATKCKLYITNGPSDTEEEEDGSDSDSVEEENLAAEEVEVEVTEKLADLSVSKEPTDLPDK